MTLPNVYRYSIVSADGKSRIECLPDNIEELLGLEKWYTSEELGDKLGGFYSALSRDSKKWKLRKYSSIKEWQRAI